MDLNKSVKPWLFTFFLKWYLKLLALFLFVDLKMQGSYRGLRKKFPEFSLSAYQNFPEFTLINPYEQLQNKRSELVSKCRHDNR